MGNLVTVMAELCKDSVPLGFDAASLGYRNPTSCLETSVGIRLPSDTASYPTRTKSSATSPPKPRNSQNYLTLQIGGEHGDNGWLSGVTSRRPLQNHGQYTDYPTKTRDRTWDSRAKLTRLLARRPRNSSSISGRGKRFFSFPKSPDRLSGSMSLLRNGNRGIFFMVVQWPGREAEKSVCCWC